jgi:hypothetical protein
MSPSEHARAQPEGRKRQKPGIAGGGEYYHIAVRDKEDFVHSEPMTWAIRGMSSELPENAKAARGIPSNG